MRNATDRPQFLIIADDLTGANDAGVQARAAGFEAVTLFDAAYGSLDTACDVVVFDTESRVNGARFSEDASTIIEDFGDRIIYKKVDSTLRGSIAVELETLADIYRPDSIVFAPAFPAAGRTTVQGVQLVHGVRVDETEFADDPLTPVHTSRLTDLFHEAESLTACDADPTVSYSSGTVECHDAVTQRDLDAIVSAGLSRGGRTLWAGSAGLAQSLFRAIGSPSGSGEADDLRASRDGTARRSHAQESSPGVLVFVGSLSEVSFLQTERYIEARDPVLVSIDPTDTVEPVTVGGSGPVSSAVKHGQDVLITTNHRMKDAHGHTVGGRGARRLRRSNANAISDTIEEYSRQISAQCIPAGIVATGGETAIRVLRGCGATGIELQSELEAGVPIGRVLGGKWDQVAIVTKAGAFGEQTTLVRAVMELRRRYGLLAG